MPAELSAAHGDPVLVSAAKLILGYHDATAPLLDAPAAMAAGLEVSCHNDLSPCNFVFRAGLPVATIDFDAAAPGTRAHDLGYAVWLWLDLGCTHKAALELFLIKVDRRKAPDLCFSEHLCPIERADRSDDALEQRRRLDVFLNAYGLVPTRAEVVLAILHRQDLLVAQGQRTGNTAMTRWAQHCRAWTRNHFSDEDIIRTAE